MAPGTAAARTAAARTAAAALVAAVTAHLAPLGTAIVSGALLVGERQVQPVLQRQQVVGADRTALSARDDETQCAVERGQLLMHQGACQLLRQPQPRDGNAPAVVLLYVIVDRHRPIADLHGPRQCPRCGELRLGHEVATVDQHGERPDLLPARGLPHVRRIPGGELGLPKARRDAAEATPHLADLLHHRLIAAHGTVAELSPRRRLGQQVARPRRVFRREHREWLALAR